MQELNSAGCAVSDNTVGGYFSAGKVPIPLFGYYEKVLGAIYTRPFDVENEGMGELLREVMGLLDVAEYLGCMHVLRRTVDSMLAEHGQDLYQSIASCPEEWGMLAMRIRSFNILREAVIHLTGQWKSVAQDEKKNIAPNLRILVESKDKLLDQSKQSIETRLANWYPAQLQHRARLASPSEHGRAEYASHIMDWMALHIWRQWLCHALIHGWLRTGSDGGLACYRMLAAGGSAYLTKEDLNEWHKNFEMSSRGKNNLAICLDRMKLKVKEIVQPLLKNESALNVTDYPVKYFTCTSVDKRDMLMLWEEDTLEWDQPVVASCGAYHSHMLAQQLTTTKGVASPESAKLNKTAKGIAPESTTPKCATSQDAPKPNKKTKGITLQSTISKRAAEQEAPEANKKAKIADWSTWERAAEQEVLQSKRKAERDKANEQEDANSS